MHRIKNRYKLFLSTASKVLTQWLTWCGRTLKMLRIATATWALVHSTAGYWCPVWCRNAYTHLIDTAINDALRIVTGCLRPTPADNLPILASIQPAELRDKGATLSTIARQSHGGWTSPLHLTTITEVQPSEWIADDMRKGSRALRASVLSSSVYLMYCKIVFTHLLYHAVGRE